MGDSGAWSQEEETKAARAMIGENGNMLKAEVSFGECMKVTNGKTQQTTGKKPTSADKSMGS